ncbi:hemolysin III family protein [Falsochrobactrum sp. TDYN1]|uniref:Hemolysin III family protein n=1 Tax=Falsochrobactrum tianjinense TaxID=2706015 RepID=A0A949PL01_9HYPH|nr:hemolysin III family protein [Falsochrobactrum sp. TDYN1]MBV2142240.1 hemolysin III family protein [Falsochrobactrum sp. TDYN1]
MNMKIPYPVKWKYDRAELWADGVIHVLGVTLAVAGVVAMLVYAVPNMAPAASISSGVYLASLLTALAISAIYNIWPVSPTKWFLRRFDHSAIYLLIAGTYTPFAIHMGASAWPLLLFVWSVAIVGIMLKLFMPGRFDRLSILLYLALGWSGVMVYDAMVQSLPPIVFWLIAAGGIVYSLGVIFHVWERLRFQNAIWHGFVVVGAALHYCAVFFVSAVN